MAAPRYISLVTGVRRMIAAITASAGTADAEKIVATNTAGILADSIMNAAETGASKVVKTKADGTLDPSIMPAGVGADTATLVASEAIASGDFVNVWSDVGVAKVRKADAVAEGKRAHGFVLAAVALNGNALVYFEGRNTALATLTVGSQYFLSAATPGAATVTAPAGVGNVVQPLGVAFSASTLSTEIEEPTTLA